MQPGYVAISLLVLAMVLFVAEVFIPSGGVIVVTAIGVFAAACFYAWHAWWASSPASFWGFTATAVVLVPIIVAVAFSIWPHTAIGRRAILQEPRPEEIASFVEQDERNAHLVGKVGEAVTMMNPAGIMLLDGQRLQCQSEGMVIDAGTVVKVVSARGNRVIVRRVPQENTTTVIAQGPQSMVAVNPPPLDFEIDQR